MADDDLLAIRIRLQGARQVMADSVATAEAVKGMGAAVETAGKKTQFSRIESGLWRQGLYTLRREMFYVTLGVQAFAIGMVKLGYDFNEAEDKGVVAFTGILGSTRAARREMDALIGLTHKTGFQLPQLTGAATRMLDFDFTVKQANAQLAAFAIFSQKRSFGVAGIDTLTSIYARVKDAGFLTGRNILALTRDGIPALQILQKQLGLTALQAEQVRRGKLALPACTRTRSA